MRRSFLVFLCLAAIITVLSDAGRAVGPAPAATAAPASVTAPSGAGAPVGAVRPAATPDADAAGQESAVDSAPVLGANASPLRIPGRAEVMPGRVLLKVAAQDRPAGGGGVPAGVADSLAARGVTAMRRVFPTATTPSPASSVQAPAGGGSVPTPNLSLWYRAAIEDGADVDAAVASLKAVPGVLAAEPDYIRRPVGEFAASPVAKATGGGAGLATQQSRPPSGGGDPDPLRAQQWHLDAAHVPEAWAWLEGQGLPPGGDRNIIVAVIDTGVDITHPDLAANIWTNAQEVPGNGVDDDGNGYVDDVHGADMITPSGNPMDDHGHGTHVAGIIAAQKDNGLGGVGVAYNVQIMPIKAAQYSGVLATSDIAEGIYYAVQHGADVINMSFGGYSKSQVEEDALTVAFGQAVLVAAAGNDGVPNERACDPIRCDGHVSRPPTTGCWASWLVAEYGSRPRFSNLDCVGRGTPIEYELLAPGVGIWSTLPHEQYAAWSGTSMATPIVSGLAALLRTKFADKDSYSSRFIMGQIASNGASGADALAALTVSPKPDLSYLRHWAFDSTSLSPDNDGDGVIDAGETIDLARRHPQSVGQGRQRGRSRSTRGPMAQLRRIRTSPWSIDTVDYGAVGSFSEDDNGARCTTRGQ